MPTPRKPLAAVLIALATLPLTAQATNPQAGENRTAPQEVAAASVSPLETLEAAAAGGDLAALAALAKHFREGASGVRDAGRAIGYDRKIAEGFAYVTPHSDDAITVVAAVLRLADAYTKGVPEARLEPRADIAQALLTHGASVFGDREAQYRLGMLLLDGAGPDTSKERRAARWLLLAARKGHRAAQVVLGEHLVQQRSEASRLKGAYWLETAAKSDAPTGQALRQAVLAQ